MLKFTNLTNKQLNNYIEAGCDEVGRGSLCNPVVAASIILDENFEQNLINDSKKLSFKTRMDLDSYIKNNVTSFAIAELPPSFINEHNMLNSNIDSILLALDKLLIRPELILVDGNKLHSYHFISHQCVIKGDSKFLSIAAVSILAKNHPYKLIIELHKEHPQADVILILAAPQKSTKKH